MSQIKCTHIKYNTEETNCPTELILIQTETLTQEYFLIWQLILSMIPREVLLAEQVYKEFLEDRFDMVSQSGSQFIS